MNNMFIKKTLVICIILLMIGISFKPVLSAEIKDTIEKKSKENFLSYSKKITDYLFGTASDDNNDYIPIEITLYDEGKITSTYKSLLSKVEAERLAEELKSSETVSEKIQILKSYDVITNNEADAIENHMVDFLNQTFSHSNGPKGEDVEFDFTEKHTRVSLRRIGLPFIGSYNIPLPVPITNFTLFLIETLVKFFSKFSDPFMKLITFLEKLLTFIEKNFKNFYDLSIALFQLFARILLAPFVFIFLFYHFCPINFFCFPSFLWLGHSIIELEISTNNHYYRLGPGYISAVMNFFYGIQINILSMIVATEGYCRSISARGSGQLIE